MDAARIINQRAARGGGRSGGAILGQVLNGIAAAQAQQNYPDPRFAPQNHAPLENLIRESVVRHNQAGGQLSPHTNQWVTQHGHNHHSGLGFDQRAEVLLQAMIMAAQADGKIDAAEQENIILQLQPLDRAEADYLRREFGRRHDVHAFVHAVPRGMEYEVYQVSLMSMNLDTLHEANYLRELAS